MYLAKLDILTAQFHEDISELGAVKRVTEQADESEDFDPDEEEFDTDEGTDDFDDDDEEAF